MADRITKTINGTDYIFVSIDAEGKPYILVYYEDKNGGTEKSEKSRITKKNEGGGYGNNKITSEAEEYLFKEIVDPQTNKIRYFVALGAFNSSFDERQFRPLQPGLDKISETNYWNRQYETNPKYLKQLIAEAVIIPYRQNTTLRVQEIVPQTEVASTEEAPAPAQLDSRQVEYWNKIAELPIGLLNESSNSLLQEIKDAYPDQITAKPLTKEDWDKLSPTEKAALEQRLVVFNNRGKDVDPASITSGTKIILADPCRDNFFAELETKLDRFFKVITNAGNFLLNLNEEINLIVEQIATLAKQLVGRIASAISKELEELIETGLENLANFIFDTVTNNPIAKATEEQKKLIKPTNALFAALKCLVANITEALEKSVRDLITEMIKNVINVPRCAIEQFIGALLTKITSFIDSTIGPLLEPVQKALGFVLNIKDAVKTALQTIRKIQNLFICDEERKCPASNEWKIDYGNTSGNSEDKEQDSLIKAFDGFDRISNYRLSSGTANLIGDFEQQYGQWSIFGDKTTLADINVTPCNIGNVFECGTPKVEFFGGGGFGASGEVILGKFVDNLDSENVYGDIKKTGSIIGVDITNPGGSYKNAPLVTFSDGCDQGYGAYGKAVIDNNPNSPNYGKVTSVIITSQGEGYPADEYEPEQTFIDDFIIENPGSGYADDDSVNDDLKLVVENGSITSVEIVSQKPYAELPEININTVTGYGAVIRPIMRTRRKPQQKVVQVIDCVS